MEIALNSDTPGGFTHENAIASQNGLALLASLTLKNALNINSNNSNSTSKNDNNINKQKHKNNYNNDLNLSSSSSSNHNNKHNIRHKSPQPKHDFISSTTVTTSLSSSTTAVEPTTISSSSCFLSKSSKTNLHQQQQVQDHKNIFTFTAAGLQAIASASPTVSAVQNEIACGNISQQQQQHQTSSTTALGAVAALSSKNNNLPSSIISTNRLQTNNRISSAKDPTVALLEALSIKTNKKQQNVSTQQQQQQQVSDSSSSIITTHSAVGNAANNNSGNSGITITNSNKNSFKIPSDILDDLASRFIINVPDMELSNLIRICFQIELAHWFYLDFFCASEDEKKLQPCGIRQFALHLFEHIPFLRHHLSSIDKILEDWKNYKLSVPTYGAILISEDLNYCLLVQSYFAKSSWGFPKGKVNENEDPVHCATREVYEETGYDITELIVPSDYIEAVINYQYTRLYIVRDVSLETKFSPRTRNEIKCCDWFPIDSLPVSKNDAISKPKLGINANSFFMIIPFVKRLKKWVNDKRNGVETRHKYSCCGSPTAQSPLTTAVMMKNKKQQKRNNANNFNDDINALNNRGGAVSTTNSTSNSNRSKRQRHKSMGDLDGIKLNNFNNSNNQNNSKSTNNNINNNNCGSTIAATSTTIASSSGNNTNNNQKRHSKIVAAGSNVSNNINNNTINCCNTNNSNNNNNINNNINNNGSNSLLKRQLFHSQSQTNSIQQSGEKIVSSFDLIRKEKQLMKVALAKAPKLQQNSNSNSNVNNGRQRAKSQSDKMSMQHQSQQQQKPNGNGSNKHQQRIQKQQSLIVTNSSMQNYNMNSNNNTNHHNNINSNKNTNNNNNKQNCNTKNKLNVNSSFNNVTTEGYKTPTPPPLNGKDLLALAAAAAAVTSVPSGTSTKTKASSMDIANTIFKSNNVTESNISNNGQQKPRPSSVSLYFPEDSIKKEATNILGNDNQIPQLQRMASGTNLRILRRSTSHQSTQQYHSNSRQLPQRQASALQFTPSFNSWTNFTFTKNFIANIFC